MGITRDIEKDEDEIHVLRKRTTPRYVGIIQKLSIWTILVISHIMCRKYIIEKCGGADNAASLGRAIQDDPDILKRKKWFVLYWLGLFVESILSVLLLYILSSEKFVLAGYFISLIKIVKGFYYSISTSSFAKLLKKWILKFQELSRRIIPFIENYVRKRNIIILGLIYAIVRMCLERFIRHSDTTS